ncbi:hypothetical protein ACLMJK_008401 [Lecanora helva]
MEFLGRRSWFSTVCTALVLSSTALAEIESDFTIDRSLGKSAIGNVQAYVKALNANPDWTSNIASLEEDVPAEVAAEVESDPQSFVELLATETTTPAYLSAVPTGVVQTLTSLASAPLHAVSDIEVYVKSLSKHGYASAISELRKDVPKSVQDAAIADPIGFLATVAAAPTNQSWVSAVPASLQGPLASAINHALMIVQSDVPIPNAANATVLSSQIMPVATTTAGLGQSSSTATATPASGAMMARSATASPVASAGDAKLRKASLVGFTWMIGALFVLWLAV